MEELNVAGRIWKVDGPLTPEIRAQVVSRLQGISEAGAPGECTSCGSGQGAAIQTLTPTCTTTAKAGNSTIDLKIAPMGGTANYSVKYQKKLSAGALTDIPGSSSSGLTESTSAIDYRGLFTYTITDADVVAAAAGDASATPALAAGKIRFAAVVTDSCPTGAKTSTEICDVSTSCGTPTANFTTV